MSDIQTLFNTYYAPNIKLSYQGSGKLANLVYNQGVVVGNKVSFPLIKKKEIHFVNRNSVDIVNARQYDKAEADIRSVQSNDRILDVDKALSIYTPENIIRLAESHSLEISRGTDGVIITDALMNATNTALGGAGSVLTKTLLNNIREDFDGIGASGVDRFVVIGAKQKTQLLNIKEYTTVLNTVAGNQPLTTGLVEVFPFLGLNFVVIEDRPVVEGLNLGLPVDTTTNTKLCFAFKKDAIGFGSCWSKIASMERDPTFGGGGEYLNSILQCGSTIIDQQGVQPIILDN
jgi:hypothetical protein